MGKISRLLLHDQGVGRGEARYRRQEASILPGRQAGKVREARYKRQEARGEARGADSYLPIVLEEEELRAFRVIGVFVKSILPAYGR